MDRQLANFTLAQAEHHQGAEVHLLRRRA
jgi:methyl-accepting chemotaxis protein